jgi:hypothetical protein
MAGPFRRGTPGSGAEPRSAPGHLPVGTRRRSVRALAMSADAPVADTWRRPTSAGRYLVWSP